MAAGKRAFSGKTQASVIASILATDPAPLSRVAPMTPPALERLIRSCMAKDRGDRIQSAHDVKLQLEWIGAGAAAVAAIAFAIGFVLRAPVPVKPLRVSILPPEKHNFDPLSVAIS